MKRIFFILAVQLMFTFPSFAIDRQELLKLCSSQAKKVILNDYIDTAKPAVNYLGLTTWLSGEDHDEQGTLWTYTHVARIQKADSQYMSWDFTSVVQPSTDSCNLISVKKERETNLLPPCEDNECNSDDNNDFINLTSPISSSANQCFYKHEAITKIPGSHLLPEQICFSELEVTNKKNSLDLEIKGSPVSGSFPLTLLKEDENISKYMTYIINKDHVDNDTQMEVTIRVSVDVLKNSTQIDYTYLAAEFFVFHKDGGYDTHIYYYKRKP